MKDHAARTVADDFTRLGRTTVGCKVVSAVDTAGWMVD